jgi:two-component sensor histidine kinase
VFQFGPSGVIASQGLTVHGRSREGFTSKSRRQATAVRSQTRGQKTAHRVIGEALLRWFALDPGLAASARPLDVIVEKLARTLGADGVYIGQLLELVPGKACTIAWWRDGRQADSVAYDVAESPYRTMWRMSFVTHPLTNGSGELIGHIAVVRRGSWKDERLIKRLLAMCSSRIAGEVERYGREIVVSLLSSVDMHTFVHELVSNVRRTLSNPSTTIVTVLRIDPISLPLHLATPCGLIISELLSNAFHHAFVGAARGTIETELTSDGRVVTLVVSDNGRGLEPDAEGLRSQGLGLQLVRLLATRQLQGQVSVSRDNGTTFRVMFPLGTTGSIADSARQR